VAGPASVVGRDRTVSRTNLAYPRAWVHTPGPAIQPREAQASPGPPARPPGRWLQVVAPGGDVAGATAALGLTLIASVRRRRSDLALLKARGRRGPPSSLRATLDARVSMKSFIFAAVVTVAAITLLRRCLRTLRQEMRSGPIPAAAASWMMIPVRQWRTTRCAHASWQAGSGLAECKSPRSGAYPERPACTAILRGQSHCHCQCHGKSVP
jgi:MYXO-CTERM domain-containing protein